MEKGAALSQFIFSAVEQSSEGIAIADLEGILMYVSPAWARMHGYDSGSELIGHSLNIFHSPEQLEKDVIPFNAVVREKGVNRGEVGHVRVDNTPFPTFMTVTLLKNSQGRPTALLGIARDITERKQTEKLLQESEEKYRLLFKNMLNGFALHEAILDEQDEPADFIYLEVNASFEGLTGLSGHDIIGKKVSEVLPVADEDREIWLLSMASVAKTGEPLQFEHYFAAFDKHLSITAYSPQKGQVAAILNDFTERAEMQQELVRSKEEWEEVFNIINDAITIHDRDYNIIKANRAAEEMLGLSRFQILTQKCFKSYHGTPCAPSGCPSCMTLKNGKSSVTELFEPNINRHIEIKALPRFNDKNELIGIVHVVRDIDSRVKAEKEKEKLTAQLIQSQKMESVGRLAGGIAHDFNNLLTTIIGYSELVLDELPAGHPLADDLKVIKNSGDMASDLTRQLLAFSRKQMLEMHPVQLHDVVMNMSKMINRVIGENILLDLNTSPTRKILADKGQIEQVIMNLVVNARDAMPEGGRILFELSEVKIDKTTAPRREEMKDGLYVLLTVTDSGTGMAAEEQKHIFEPFYTTKEKGKGTGLGLSTVYGIIKQHNGYIYVDSEPGRGAAFKIYLPITPVVEKNAVRKLLSPGESLKGSETILMVEDERAIRKLVTKILEPLGYTILSAANAEEAREITNTYPKKIDLLLADIILPGKNGKELADSLQEIIPGLKVLFMTGYTDDSISNLGVLDSGVQIIYKPLSPQKLAEKVRIVLENQREIP